MADKEDEDFYFNLSRKELQDLCKKYGLSANKTNSILAKSLASYSEKKNLSLISSGEWSSGTKEAFLPISLIPQVQPGEESNSMGDARKDSCGILSGQREEDNQEKYSQTVKFNELGSCMGAETYNKASGNEISEGFRCSIYNIRETSNLTSRKRETSHSQFVLRCDETGFKYKKESPKISSQNLYLASASEGGVGNVPQIQCRDINFGACPAENALTSSTKSSTKVPSSSFEFYVRSEEGIKLYVDLNSSSSDWTTRLKNEVCICQNVHNNKSRSLHQELGRLRDSNKQIKDSFWNTDSGHEINDSNTTSSPSSVIKENGHVGFDHPDGSDGSLRSSAVKSCSVAVEMSGHLEEDHALLLSSRPNPDVQNQMISGTESCPGDGETITFDSVVSNTPQIKSACNSVVTSTSDGSKILDASKHQNSKLDNEICEYSILQNPCRLVSPSLIFPGGLASGSVELQLSEIESHCEDASCSPCKKGGFCDLVDPMHNIEAERGGLANSNELNHDNCRNCPPTCAKGWERTNLDNWRESSKCSHFDNSSEKTCVRSDDSESNEGLQIKRQHNDGEDHNDCDKPDAKILRSTKHLAVQVIPRRSMRLVSKVTTFIGDGTHRSNKSTR